MKRSSIIPESRIEILNEAETNSEGDYALYLMQRAHRCEQNFALEYAVKRANEMNCPLLVCFGYDPGFPDANDRHLDFMLGGLQKTSEALKRRNIGFVFRTESPLKVVKELAADATEVIVDKGYLRYHRSLYRDLSGQLSIKLTQVETDCVVPHSLVSDKQEYAARTIRPKVMNQLDEHLVWLETTSVDVPFQLDNLTSDELGRVRDSLDFSDVHRVTEYFPAGTPAARARFDDFLKNELSEYDEKRSQPHDPRLSHMSPYLHFGQISPLYLLLRMAEVWDRESKNTKSFTEELAVRRSLAQNFCLHQQDYDSFQCLPGWAKESLEKHKDDERENIYTRKQLENGETDDPYWNAAQREMVLTGYMHNHMRMYWGKRILGWCNTPEYAYQTALYLNNKYFLDGRDPNSFANVAWLFGLHDQGWKERAVYGKVRIMTQGGLKRKTDPEAYRKKVEQMSR